MTKAGFPRACEVAYLDTAAEGLPPKGCAEALEAYLREKGRGSSGRARIYEMQRETECSVARLLGTSAENIALLANASEALNLLANSIDWRPGDRVLLTDLEFPSNVLAWLRLKDLGVQLDVIPTERGVVCLDQFRERLDERTRLVSVSQVSYKSGTHIPFLAQLAKETHRAGALFCVDATQALGRVPVSVEGVDFLVGSSYKWLLGTHGLGIVYCSPSLYEQLGLGNAGWYSVEHLFRSDRFERFDYKAGARRLQAGMPNFPAIYALKVGVDYLLQFGVERIDRELRPVIAELRQGLEALGLDLLTPAEPDYNSGIVSFAWPSPESLALELERQGIIVWGGDGRVRVSAHLYNDRDDIRRCLEALESLVAG